MKSLHEEFLINFIAEEQPALVALQLGITAADFGDREQADHLIDANIAHWIESCKFTDKLADRKKFSGKVKEFAAATRSMILQNNIDLQDVFTGVFYPQNSNFVTRHYKYIRGHNEQCQSYYLATVKGEGKSAEQQFTRVAEQEKNRTKHSSHFKNMKKESETLQKKLDHLHKDKKLTEIFNESFNTQGFYSYEQDFENFIWASNILPKPVPLTPLASAGPA
jgi:hypothetical protein